MFKLNWAYKGFPTVLTEKGWDVRLPYTSEVISALASITVPQIGNEESAALISGQRVQVLKNLKTALATPPKIAYVDLPRLTDNADAPFESKNPEERLVTWLTVAESVVAASIEAVSDGGWVIVHIDDSGAAYLPPILEGLGLLSSLKEIIHWQKKYAAQQDLRDQIDDAYDTLYCIRVGGTNEDCEYKVQCWDYKKAGKTEDATREMHKLKKDKVVADSIIIPKTSKPQKLCDLLLKRFSVAGDRVVEVFSQTGYFSAAALGLDRRAIVLTGSTSREIEFADNIIAPRLACLLSTAKLRSIEVLAVKLDKVPLKDRSNTISDSLLRSEFELGTEIYSPPRLIEGRIALSAGRKTGLFASGSGTKPIHALTPAIRGRCGLVWLNTFAENNRNTLSPEEVIEMLVTCSKLVSMSGLLVIPCSPETYPKIRISCERAFGESQYIGTVIDPSGGSGPIYYPIFRPGSPQSKRIFGFIKKRDYSNPDGDVRGEWRHLGYKGARSGGEEGRRKYCVPPYRYALSGGELPPGTFLNEVTGVIFGNELTNAGIFKFTIDISDSGGKTSSKDMVIEVLPESSQAPSHSTSVWWLTPGASRPGKTAPRIKTEKLPIAFKGCEYSCVLKASGGKPYPKILEPGADRYWPFNLGTLTRNILRSLVVFGQNGTANPSFKKFPEDDFEADGAAKKTVTFNWWSESNLEKWHCGSIFDGLLDIGTSAGDLLVFVDDFDTEPSQSDRLVFRFDTGGDRSSRGSFPCLLAVGPEFLREKELQRFPKVLPNNSKNKIVSDIAWSQGFFPTSELAQPPSRIPKDRFAQLDGLSLDLKRGCIVLGPEEWLTESRVVIASRLLQMPIEEIYLFYFRGSCPVRIPRINIQRIPFDLRA